MQIRLAEAAERPAIDAVVAAAFDEPLDGRVTTMMRALDTGAATHADIVAARSADVVGHVRLSLGWIDARRELVPVLILSPLSVAPGHQRGGIGTRLVEAALAEADRQQATAVFLEGSPDYYGQRGFTRASAHGLYRPSVRIPDAAFQVAFCTAYSPWMKGAVVYPQAFWETDTVGLRDPLLAQIEERLA